MTHYKLSPSASSRWLNCPGSLQYDQTQSVNEHMLEGTRVHSICERAITTRKIEHEGDEEVKRCVSVYLAEVQQILLRDPIIHRVETTVVHQSIADLGGTADFFAIYEEDSKLVLHIVDYKHGAGIPVYAEENSQLLTYAAIINSQFFDIEIVRLTIVQPRAHNHDEVQTWETSITRVLQHEQAIVTASQSTKLCAGSWCRYCAAAPDCQVMHELLVKTARLDFAKADIAELLELHDLGPTLNEVLKKIKIKLLEYAKEGAELPAHKVIESVSHRRWNNSEDEILKQLSKLKIGKKLATTSKLKSPAQIEKLLPDKAQLTGLVTQHITGYKVVQENAKGRACDLSTINVETEFGDLEDE